MQIALFVLPVTALAFFATPFASADGHFDRTLKVSGPVELDVSTDSGGIVVTTGPAGLVQIHAILRARNGWLATSGSEARIREIERNPPVEQIGNRVRIGSLHDPLLSRGVSMRLEIQTPVDTRLRAAADSGGIQVDGIRGPAECKTDSGGIEVRRVGSDVRASADSGGIHIRDVNGAIVAQADSGGIEAYDIAGSIEARTDSGGIRLSQTKAAAIRAQADSGGVQATLAPGAGYDIDVHTDSGRISVPEMTLRQEISRHHISGKVRGGGPAVTMRVDSGTVSIN